ncbi:MAG: four helix bundle protein [Patescibacteria group bacterium]
MQTQNKTKDIKQRTFDFSIQTIKLISNFPNKTVYWKIGDQLLRSGTSIGANVTEAQGSLSKKEFISFYHIALKSAKETVYWLEILQKSDLIKESELSWFLDESNQLVKMLTSSILTLKRNLN